MDNVEIDVRVLGFEETWTEQETYRIEWRKTVVVALGLAPSVSE